MEKQIKLFLEFLQNDKKLSDNTLQSYQRDILQFQDYLKESDLNYAKLTEEDLKILLLIYSHQRLRRGFLAY